MFCCCCWLIVDAWCESSYESDHLLRTHTVHLCCSPWDRSCTGCRQVLCLSVCLSLSLCLSLCLSVCLSLSLSVSLSVCLSVSLCFTVCHSMSGCVSNSVNKSISRRFCWGGATISATGGSTGDGQSVSTMISSGKDLSNKNALSSRLKHGQCYSRIRWSVVLCSYELEIITTIGG